MEQKTEGVKQSSGKEGGSITEKEGSQTAQQQDTFGRGSANCDQEDKLDFYSCVATICESSLFTGLITLISIMDAVLIGLETDLDLKIKHSVFFAVAEIVFLAIYIMEFLMKVYVERRKYLKKWSNVFDVVLLCVSGLSVFRGTEDSIADISLSSIIRQLRSMRLLRVLSSFPPLQFLIKGMSSIISTVMGVIGIMLVLMFIFAIGGFYLFGGPNSADPKSWGSLGSTFLTLFSLVTLDGWTDKQQALDSMGISSTMYMIVFIILSTFITYNMFTAVVCREVLYIRQKVERHLKMEREKSVALKKQAMMLRQQEEIRQLMQACMGNASNFEQRVQQFKKCHLPPHTVVMEKPCASMAFPDLFLHILHLQDKEVNRMSQHLDEMTMILRELQDLDQQEQEKR